MVVATTLKSISKRASLECRITNVSFVSKIFNFNDDSIRSNNVHVVQCILSGTEKKDVVKMIILKSYNYIVSTSTKYDSINEPTCALKQSFEEEQNNRKRRYFLTFHHQVASWHCNFPRPSIFSRTN